MTEDEIAAIRETPANATFRDVRALIAEIDRLRAALDDMVTGTHRHDTISCCGCGGLHCCCVCPEGDGLDT